MNLSKKKILERNIDIVLTTLSYPLPPQQPGFESLNDKKCPAFSTEKGSFLNDFQ